MTQWSPLGSQRHPCAVSTVPRTRSCPVSHLLMREGIASAGASQCLGRGLFLCSVFVVPADPVSVGVTGGAESETNAL